MRIKFILGLIMYFYCLCLSASEKNTVNINIVETFSKNKNILLSIKKNVDDIQVRGAQGEFESASFVISSDSNVRDIRISQSALYNHEYVIARENIDIKYVLRWYQAAGAWETHRKKKSKSILVPELLVNDPTLVKLEHVKRRNLIKQVDGSYVLISKSEIPKKREALDQEASNITDALNLMPLILDKGEYQQVFLTVKIPEEAQPGKYFGTIKVSNSDFEKEVSMVVNVLPFRLEKTPVLYSLYYRAQLSNTNIMLSSEWKTENQLRSELSDMFKHGVSNPTIYQRYYPKDKEQTIEGNKIALKKYLQIRNDVGMDNETIYYLGMLAGGEGSLKNLSKFKENLSELKIFFEENGVRNLYIYGKEEKKSYEYAEQFPAWSILEGVGVKLFVAVDKTFFDREQNKVDLLVFHDDIKKSFSIKAHEMGAEIMSYSNPQVGVENPNIFRENYGFNLIKNNFDGVMNYAYQDSMGQIWNDWDHKYYRDLAFTYPTLNGVIGTLAWEGFREAIDDTRYFQTYRRVYQECISKNKNLVNIYHTPQDYLEMDIESESLRNKLIDSILSLEKSECEI